MRIRSIENVTRDHNHVRPELQDLLYRPLERGSDVTLPHVHPAVDSPVGPKSEVKVGQVRDDHGSRTDPFAD